MENLNLYEMESINGGKLSSLSDWLLLGSGICFSFCCPPVGIAATIAVGVFS